jgi:phage minor structural protein
MSNNMIYIIDFDGKVQGVLSNELPSSIPFWEDMYVENIEDAQSTYEFKCPADGTESIKVENYVAIQDLDGQLVLFKIREIQTFRDSDGKLYKQVFAENAALELLKTIVRPRSFSGVTATQVLTDILQGTLWQVGIVEITDVNNIEFTDYITAIEAIQNIKDTYGGEIRYRVELNGGQIYKRNIDLLERRGQYTGKRFTYSKDIKSITRTEDTSELYTAVIGLGKADENGNIPTITNTTGTFTNKYGTTVTKYAGQDYIGDPDALARWSDDGQHLMGVYKTEETVPFVILQKTWEFLQQHIEPKLSYEVDVALLEQIAGYEHEKARIGDTVIVEDLEFEPALVLEARIVEIGISQADPSQNYVKLSNFVELQIAVEQQVQGLLDYIRKKEEMWNNEQSIYKGSTPPPNPREDQLWLDTSTEPNVLKRWNGKAWINASPTEPIDIGAETPKGSQDKADIAALQTEKNLVLSERAKFNYQVARLLEQEFKTENIKQELIDAKSNYDEKCDQFLEAINKAITIDFNNAKRTAATLARTSALNVINDEKRAMVDAARIEYQAAVERLSNAIEAAEKDVGDQQDAKIISVQSSITQLDDRITLEVEALDNRMTSYDSQINVMYDQINLKVSQKTYNTDISNINSRLANAESQISLQANQINLKVSQSTYNSDISSINSRLSNVESQISIQADQISSKVSQTDFNGNTIASLINQTATNVTISANKIDLNGITRVSDALWLGSSTSQTRKALNFKSSASIYTPNYSDNLVIESMGEIYLSSGFSNGVRVRTPGYSVPIVTSYQSHQPISLEVTGSGGLVVRVNGKTATFAPTSWTG